VSTIAPPSPDLSELAAQLRLGVTRLARKLRREADPAVTPTQLAALNTIERHGPLTAGSLAEHEQITKPTATRLIGALTEAGLITRQSDPLDARIAWIALTPDGARLLRRVRHQGNRYLAKRLKALEPSELESLRRAAAILERLTGDKP
jgi:DNA-binding MarR family transcriptional regulator